MAKSTSKTSKPTPTISKSASKPPGTLPQTHRIRDNQRRSRARRKEYLSTLEAKLAHCERVGVAANQEIQRAARRVLEENVRLRGVLRGLGWREGEGDGEGARVLEGLLGRVGWGCESGLKEPSVVAMSSASDVMIRPRPAPAEMDTVVDRHQPELNGLSSDRNKSTSNETTTTTNEEVSIISPPPNASHTNHSPQPNTTTTSQPPRSNCSSCKSVATAIRSIRPDVGTELEEDLGCPVNDNEDCSVPNTQAFDILDRYSDGRG
ncbi:hypothetical protein M409DRAFT_23721 [Zasmidium cellare ATCC 36951]|uniref:BZIP domain-containing protein n=1 Tax=Zasmidium cellare ATCC 36951 TaxID=1080233 RepID=A0A6A6CFK9_ZASCE|nr:uncharacterized protein M409DRAFT_23721 [Zasmidium cellare ATCC 36951]KAF2165994.1 hypothetical protein M409DRAFT_23721 [Zasmidium cellare ATCC 36951]